MSDSLMGGEAAGGEAVVGEAGAAGAAGGEAGGSVPSWLEGIEGIDAEILGDPSLKAINDIPNLLKSYVNAQKMVGADKVIIPGKDASPEEISQFYAKMGKPGELDKFELTSPDGSPLEEGFRDTFKQAAFDANLLPAQAQKILEAMNGYEVEANKSFLEKGQETFKDAVDGLKTEWGEAFESKVAMSTKAAREFGGDEFITYLNESGLGNNPELVKIFSKIGSSVFKEDTPAGGRPTGGALSPEEAQSKYDEIMRDSNDPYHNASVVGHKRRVDEVQKLFVAMG